MKFILDDYIENYLQNENNADDRKIASHLKNIIPQTTHLKENTFNEIIETFKNKMNNNCNFKAAFREVCKKYVLIGDRIKADLPAILTRIILNDSKFIERIMKKQSIQLWRKDIENIVAQKNQRKIKKLFTDMTLSIRKVVFATFDENDPEVDPFKKYNLDDIVNMLALDISGYKENKPLGAVKIRYKNKQDVIKRFPVFTDAGWNDRFHPSNEKDNYGRTKSLDGTFKGMPEIVHENMQLAVVIVEIDFLEMKEGK
ncbi:MAG: hypothetical protein PVH61_11400 [Candidatus Aminicenantes bacterium]|jgi:hypothetical protein